MKSPAWKRACLAIFTITKRRSCLPTCPTRDTNGMYSLLVLAVVIRCSVVVKSFTIEVCMTDLDLVSARKFCWPPGDWKTSESAGREMNNATGIRDINPKAIICDFAFELCGYSMNSIDGDHYSTIHVTPEDGFSYTSYEWVRSIYDRQEDIDKTLMKVARVFRPGNMSVSTTSTSPHVWQAIVNALEPKRLRCRSYSVDDFPGVRVVVFHAFTSCRKG